MQAVKVWDPLVRIIHWAVALLFFANLTVIDEESAAHIYIGYVVFGLILIRLVWGLIGTRYARFSAFRPSLSAAVRHLVNLLTGRRETHLSHNPLGALMVYNLLAALVLVSLTGVMADTGPFQGMDWVEEAHELVVNYTTLCVGLHVAGVLVDGWLSKTNLVKAMLTGKKEIPDTA